MNETNSTKKKNSDEEGLKDQSRSIESILKASPELPTGIAMLRGLRKSRKHRCSPQKRKR
jgi:hypothetical protein